MLCAEKKKRKSSKKTKNDDNNDEAMKNNNNNNNTDNIDDQINEGSESLQNGQSHAKIEDKEEDDIVSDLPLFGRLRRLSHSKTTGDDNNSSH